MIENIIILILGFWTFSQMLVAFEFYLTDDIDVLFSNGNFIFALTFLSIYYIDSTINDLRLWRKNETHKQ